MFFHCDLTNDFMRFRWDFMAIFFGEMQPQVVVIFCLPSGNLAIENGPFMGKPWENYGKTMGKLWENGDLY